MSSPRNNKHDVAIARAKARNSALLIDRGTAVFRTLIKSAAWVGVAYCFVLFGHEIAGKETNFKVVLDTMMKLGADRWAAYLFGGGGIAAWHFERKLRKRTILENGQHIKRLEGQLDQNRLSSGLSSDGSPKKEDADVA